MDVGGYLDPQEEKLKAAIANRGMKTGGFASPQEKQNLASAYRDNTNPGIQVDNVPTPDVAASGMDNMGGALGGAAGVAGAAGAGSPVTGALSGAALGAQLGGGPWGALIGGGVGLASGIFNDKAKREAERRQRIVESMKFEMKGKQAANRQLQQGTQSAISQIIGGSARALS